MNFEKVKLHGIYLQQFLIVLIAMIFVLSLGAWALIAHYALNKHTAILWELDSIKTQITNANIYIRNASLTPSIQERENELYKIFNKQGTLQTAWHSFDRIDKIVSGKTETKIWNQLNNYRINIYRPSQKKYLMLVRNNETDTVLWTDLKKYQEKQFGYVRHIDILYQYELQHTGANYRLLLRMIITIIAMTVLLSWLYVKHIYMHTKTLERSCWLCGEPLLSRLSLNMSVLSETGLERCVRVCSVCYTNNQTIL